MLEESALPVPAVGRPAVHWSWVVPTFVIVLMVMLVAGFEIVYSGKVLPGVSLNGIYVGGLTQAGAASYADSITGPYVKNQLTLTGAGQTQTIPINKVVSYDTAAGAADAYAYGHSGGFWQQVREQGAALIGLKHSVDSAKVDTAALASYLGPLSDSLSTPVQNAGIGVNAGQAVATPAQSGQRLNLGLLAATVESRLQTTSTQAVPLPVFTVNPAIATTSAAAATAKAQSYLAAPVQLTVAGKAVTISQDTIATWLRLDAVAPAQVGLALAGFAPATPVPAAVTLDPGAIKAYVAGLAKSTDVSPQNAILDMDPSATQVSVFQPSRAGQQLDQAAAVTAITAAITQPAASRQITLKVTTIQPQVSESNLNSLGINTLISEGISYDDFSTRDRLTNVRVGTSRFNNVLIKPGETFSFNTLLGPIGPEFGYAPGYVILGNEETLQYGGGLCQVATTAFRAALLAGLPITQRTNHSFAVSYYTKPFGVPGVDATIYPPNPDLKFTNDTGSYILIQTSMASDWVKFDFYGTKTKYGQIRGPYFVTGSNDATKPSHTVFYQDVFDMTGKLLKSNTFNSYYQSSTDFPIEAN